MDDEVSEHRLMVDPRPEGTHGACTCGAWERNVTSEDVVVSGRSREDSLKGAHDLHARGLAGA